MKCNHSVISFMGWWYVHRQLSGSFCLFSLWVTIVSRGRTFSNQGWECFPIQQISSFCAKNYPNKVFWILTEGYNSDEILQWVFFFFQTCYSCPCQIGWFYTFQECSSNMVAKKYLVTLLITKKLAIECRKQREIVICTCTYHIPVATHYMISLNWSIQGLWWVIPKYLQLYCMFIQLSNHKLCSDNKIVLPKCNTIYFGLKSFAYQTGSLSIE